MQRILVIGSPGAGKSTLARRLAERLDLPLIHLDREYFGPGWTMPSKEEWRVRVSGARGSSGLGHGRQLRQHLRHPRAARDRHRLARPPALASVSRRVTWRVVRHYGRVQARSRPGLHRALRLARSCAGSGPIRTRWAKTERMLKRLRPDQRVYIVRSRSEIAALETRIDPTQRGRLTMPTFRSTRQVKHSAGRRCSPSSPMWSAIPSFCRCAKSLRIVRRVQSGEGIETIVAAMSVGYKAIDESFHDPGDLDHPRLRITVEYVDGPFKYLENRWTFRDTPAGSEVEFYINYEFKSFALGLLMGSVFDKAFRKFAEAFEERADLIYSGRGPLEGASRLGPQQA